MEEDDVLPKQHEEILSANHGRYKVLKKVAGGDFGANYLVRLHNNDKRYLLKCQGFDSEKTLSKEFDVLKKAEKFKATHFVRVKDRGRIDGRFAFLVLPLLGQNLEELRKGQTNGRFTPNTTLKLAVQCLICIEELHRYGFLHCDVKPTNFAVGLEKGHFVFFQGFERIRRFSDIDRENSRQMRSVTPFRGSMLYGPLAAMEGGNLSRKDDLESWWYMIVEWTTGHLPWRKADSREKVVKMKKNLRNPAALESFMEESPSEFTQIFKYLDSLKWRFIPAYNYVYELIIYAFVRLGIKWNDPLDWDTSTEYNVKQEVPGRGWL